MKQQVGREILTAGACAGCGRGSSEYRHCALKLAVDTVTAASFTPISYAGLANRLSSRQRVNEDRSAQLST